VQTKKCMRSGQCCSAHFALVPKHETSNLSDEHLETVEDLDSYIATNAEMMGAPCKWLARDELTTEATCKVHVLKSSMCVNYPEHVVGSEWCPVGLGYWKHRKSEGLTIPDWVDTVLLSLVK
jgi:Fe-S-cluster containining protein